MSEVPASGLGCWSNFEGVIVRGGVVAGAGWAISWGVGVLFAGLEVFLVADHDNDWFFRDSSEWWVGARNDLLY